MKLHFLVLIGVLLLHQSSSQSRFMVDVTYFTPPRLTGGATLCTGAAISIRHVLTTASCVQVPLPQQVAIRAHETLYVNDLPSNFTYTSKF